MNAPLLEARTVARSTLADTAKGVAFAFFAVPEKQARSPFFNRHRVPGNRLPFILQFRLFCKSIQGWSRGLLIQIKQ